MLLVAALNPYQANAIKIKDMVISDVDILTFNIQLPVEVLPVEDSNDVVDMFRHLQVYCILKSGQWLWLYGRHSRPVDMLHRAE